METKDPDEIIREGDSVGTLATLSKAEIDIQISTAKRYPRSIVKFKQDALEMATLDEETAGSMFYALPRDGKRIEGPSVRLAEVIGSAWGNVRYGARIVDIGDNFITGQGVCFDLEKNVFSSIEVLRRITARGGRRYSEDMITVTGNAAMSIALRNAIFKVIPFALVKQVFEQAKEVSLGKGLSMAKRRENMLKHYDEKHGAKAEEILRLLNRRGMDDVSIDDLLMLRGLNTAINDGDTTWEQALREATKEATAAVVVENLNKIVNGGAVVTSQDDAPSGSNAPTKAEAQARAAAADKAPAPPAGTTPPTPAQSRLASF